MIAYEYRVHIAGDCVRVEAFDFNRSQSYPAFELEIIEGLQTVDYYLTADNVTSDRGKDAIPTLVKVAMIDAMEGSLFKLKRATRQVRTP